MAIRDPGTPKALRLEIVYDGSVPDDMPEDWRLHLREEISRDMFRALKELYHDIEKGDVVVFGFDPNSGSAIRLNGERVAFNDDTDLMDALLELWIGPSAVSKNLRSLLLSGRC